MANAAIKRAQARNIAKKLASGEITESEAHRLRVKRGIRTPNDAQKAQNQQAKAVSAIGDLLAGSGAGVRAEEPEKVAIEDMGISEYDMRVADARSKLADGVTLQDSRLLHAVGRLASNPAALQDEQVLAGNVILGHQQLDRELAEQRQHEIDTDNAGRR